jgi:hypothetical protein
MTDLAAIDTTIYLNEIAFHQPVTAFTDFTVTLLCFYFYKTLTGDYKKEKSIFYWKYFFLVLSIATLFGGCSHAFFTNHQNVEYKFFWLTMQLFNGFAVYAAQQATLNSVLATSEKRSLYTNISWIQLLIFIPSVFIFQNFMVVTIDMALGLIPVMLIHFKNGQLYDSSKWIAYGILISFLTAAVHLFKFSLHIYFNYLDIAHLLIAINLSVMFVGVKQKAISLASL